MPKTLAVSLENRPGAFAEIASLLGKARVDILGFSTQALGDFGQVHLLVDRTEAAREALEKAGARFRTREVVLTYIPDKPGGLASLAKVLAKEGVNIEIAFNASGAPDGYYAVVLEVSDTAAARRVLAGADLPVLDTLVRAKRKAAAPKAKAPAKRRARSA